MATKYKSVKVEIPEISSLNVDPAALSELDSLCAEARSLSTQIKILEDGDPDEGIRGKKDVMKQLVPLAESLQLPERVLGDVWDLRRVERTSTKLYDDRLKMRLMQLGFEMDVECPRVAFKPVEVKLNGKITVVEANFGDIVVCHVCHGTGTRRLTGMQAAIALIESCSETSTSVSWSVYGRSSDK